MKREERSYCKLETSLPFRHENENTFLVNIHPLIRLILPFIIVVPFLILNDIYLIISLILITLIFSLVARLNMLG